MTCNPRFAFNLSGLDVFQDINCSEMDVPLCLEMNIKSLPDGT